VIRVLIAAPSAIIRAGLESLVRSSPALSFVGSAPDLANLESAVEREQPDVVLADLEFPQEDGPPPGLLASAAVVLLVGHPPGPSTGRRGRFIVPTADLSALIRINRSCLTVSP